MGNLALGKLPLEIDMWTAASAATDGNFLNYTDKTGFAYASIGTPFTIDLGDHKQVAEIRLLLYDGLGGKVKLKDHRVYEFEVNISLDGVEFRNLFWDRDRPKGNGWFVFTLKDRINIRFIQIVGISNSVNDKFHIVELEVFDNSPSLLPPGRNVQRHLLNTRSFILNREAIITAMGSNAKSNISNDYKIFISHSRDNDRLGFALVELLEGLGVNHGNITFTSKSKYGIPIGQNIFEWLKNRIIEKPDIIFLLSPEYYSSTPCLNEMGAAWVVGNEYTVIFTKEFDLNGRDFSNGVLDPRNMGFRVNDKARLTEFSSNIMKKIGQEPSPSLITERVETFLDKVKRIRIKRTPSRT